MNEISTKPVVSPNGVGGLFTEAGRQDETAGISEVTKQVGDERTSSPDKIDKNCCSVKAKDVTEDAQLDKPKEVPSDVIKCDIIEEQSTKLENICDEADNENKSQTEENGNDTRMEVDEVTPNITLTPKDSSQDKQHSIKTDETANIEDKDQSQSLQSCLVENQITASDDNTELTEVVVVIEEKEESENENVPIEVKNVEEKPNEEIKDEDTEMQVVSENKCDDIKTSENKEQLPVTETNNAVISEKVLESDNSTEMLDKNDVKCPLNSATTVKVDENIEREVLDSTNDRNDVVISHPNEKIKLNQTNQVNDEPKTEIKKSEKHLVKNIIIKADSIKIPFVTKPDTKNMNRVDAIFNKAKIDRNFVNNMETVRKMLENPDINISKTKIPTKDESIKPETNTIDKSNLNVTNSNTPNTFKSNFTKPEDDIKRETTPEIKVNNATIKTEPDFSKNFDTEMTDIPTVSDSRRTSTSLAEARFDKKTMNGDVSRDDQTSKRRASEEVETDSPLKKLCLEVEKTFPQHDTMINDFIQNSTRNNIDEIQKHTEQLLTEIQTLRELAQKKEQEWNNILHLKKVKEEILLRLLRRKQVLSFEKSELSNTERSKDPLEHFNQNKNLAIDKSDEISGVALKPPTTNPSPIIQPPMMAPVSSHFNPLTGLPPPYDKVAHMPTMPKNLYPQTIMLPGPNMTGFPRDMNGQLNSMNNFNMPLGRQGPTKDVKSIIADYRQRNPDMVPRRGRRMKSILNPSMMNSQPRQIAPKLDNLSSLGMIFNNLDMNQKAMLERLTQLQGAGLANGMSFKDILVQFATLQNPNMMPGRPDPMACRPDMMPGRPDQMPGRPDQMSGRLDQMSGRPDQMSGRLDQMSGRPDQMPVRLDQMPGRPDQMLGRSEMLQNRLEQMPNRREQEAISRQEAAHSRNEKRRQERQSHHEELQMSVKQSERVASSSPRLPPPPYPEISLLPVNSQDGSQGPQQNSLLHGILTKQASPASQGYSPTLAKLLTSPETSTVATLPTLGQAKNCGEITITPVQPTPPPQECGSQEKPEEVVQLDEEESAAWEGCAERGGDSPETGSGRLVIDEAGEGDTPLCQGCRRRDAQFVCAGCANQWYCSRDCQVAAWDDHSEMCSG